MDKKKQQQSLMGSWYKSVESLKGNKCERQREKKEKRKDLHS